jgi:hypothetical protein
MDGCNSNAIYYLPRPVRGWLLGLCMQIEQVSIIILPLISFWIDWVLSKRIFNLVAFRCWIGKKKRKKENSVVFLRSCALMWLYSQFNEVQGHNKTRKSLFFKNKIVAFTQGPWKPLNHNIPPPWSRTLFYCCQWQRYTRTSWCYKIDAVLIRQVFFGVFVEPPHKHKISRITKMTHNTGREHFV